MKFPTRYFKRFTPLGSKDIGITELYCVAKTLFLCLGKLLILKEVREIIFYIIFRKIRTKEKEEREHILVNKDRSIPGQGMKT